MATARVMRGVFGLCVMLATTAALAGPPEKLPSLDALRSRLQLSDEQCARLEPLFERRKVELQRTRKQLVGATSRSQKRSVLRGAKLQQKIFVSEVDAALDSSQKAEWVKVRAEMRHKLKASWQARQDAQGAL